MELAATGVRRLAPMCGIVAVATRRSRRATPAIGALLDRLDAARGVLGAVDAGATGSASEAVSLASDLEAVVATLAAVDGELGGVPGVVALLGEPIGSVALEHRISELTAVVAELEVRVEADIEAGRVQGPVEPINAAFVAIKDALWAIGHDRVRGARAVGALANGNHDAATIEAYWAIQLALGALDRLEVRGRDSAGLHVLVRDHALDPRDETVRRILAERAADRLFGAGAVRVHDGVLSFVYKTAAEIGELGDNTASLRAQIQADELLRLALGTETAHVLVLAHTRWASVGIISEANAHPLNSDEVESSVAQPYVVAALNGDVDNHADLRVHDRLRIASEITTDAKVIPVLVGRRLRDRDRLAEAFRATVATFEGSVAIAAASATEPDTLLLAQRGSGQALYVGLGDDVFVVASEPYGVVEATHRYLRLDGESMRRPGDPSTQGEIVVLDGTRAGDLAGVQRLGYEGAELAVADADVHVAQMTTRDVDRGDAPHYFWKEVTEAPASLRKTLRGRIVAGPGGGLTVHLDDQALPARLREAIASGAIRRLLAIGQGTAAVAAQSLAATLQRLAAGRLSVESIAATELSGFGLAADMRDTVVVAISQSGTTTDTNRTVDLARARGATVIAIVNRRQSDLVDKSDGVLYTSDGRDVEMAVASTKAFYAQIAAGVLLSYAVAQQLPGGVDADERREVLEALRLLPAAMREVVDQRDTIAAIAQRHAPSRRYWAVVGNGVNRVAAAEVRIKLSELCYKSIACDITEDKKHIDLSAEPMILVCAPGLTGSNADDVAKELAIYRAHKAAAIAIATRGETRFGAALDTIFVPAVHPTLDFVLGAMVGHVFGYEAALAIDASARPLREARAAIEALITADHDTDDLLAAMRHELAAPATRCFEVLHTGGYDGSLEAATAVRLTTLLRYAVGIAPLETYQIELGKVGTPSVLADDLVRALTRGIAELTRPVDAIKHQAKTVTVGISRSDETLLRVRLVQDVLASGCPRDSLSYRALRTLVELDAAVDEVLGFTRYRIEGDVERGASIHVVDRGGVARDIASRTDRDSVLRGTKHRAAFEREVTVVRGRADGRTVIHVPEVKDGVTNGMTLLHVRFAERLPAEVARRVLQGYRGRYAAIQDQVTETEPTMRDDVLETIDVVDLLTEPVVALAEHWRFG